jgi:diadenosine tetraphosphate (Ap4A) HIT family hydrolase
MTECSFCALLEAGDHATRIVEFEHSVAFLTLDQSHPGRCVLILRRHLDHFHELPDELFLAFGREMRRLDAALRRAFEPDRMNHAVLGNRIAHVHWHLIPRYRGESNWGAPPWPAAGALPPPPEGYAALAERIRTAVRDELQPAAGVG